MPDLLTELVVTASCLPTVVIISRSGIGSQLLELLTVVCS
jgi:hypothetical protein